MLMMRIFLLTLLVLFQGLLIWISSRAKPLLDKPYRWGTYVGLITALAGLLCLSTFFSFFSASDIWGQGVSAFLCICATVCSIGILRRRRFGVVMFVITYLGVIMENPLLLALRSLPTTSIQKGESLPTLVFLVTTTFYFMKRWALMGQTQRIPTGSL
jgi:hypothetical protein